MSQDPRSETDRLPNSVAAERERCARIVEVLAHFMETGAGPLASPGARLRQASQSIREGDPETLWTPDMQEDKDVWLPTPKCGHGAQAHAFACRECGAFPEEEPCRPTATAGATSTDEDVIFERWLEDRIADHQLICESNKDQARENAARIAYEKVLAYVRRYPRRESPRPAEEGEVERLRRLNVIQGEALIHIASVLPRPTMGTGDPRDLADEVEMQFDALAAVYDASRTHIKRPSGGTMAMLIRALDEAPYDGDPCQHPGCHGRGSAHIAECPNAEADCASATCLECEGVGEHSALCSDWVADSSRAEPEPGARVSEDEARSYATFIGVMHDKLVENAHKGGWANDAPHLLLARVCDELAELIDVITPSKEARTAFVCASRDIGHAADALRSFGPFLKCGGKPAEVREEAADVANMVMMVADVLGALRLANPEAKKR